MPSTAPTMISFHTTDGFSTANGNKALSTASIIGIICGCLIAIGILITLCISKKKKRNMV